MIVYQLDLFDDETEVLRKEFVKVLQSNEKVRKSLFAQMNEVKKESRDLRERLEILERNICHGRYNKMLG